MTHVELKKTYAGLYDENFTKRFQAMCLLMAADSEQYSGIWGKFNNSTLLGTYNYPNTPTAAYDILCHYKKPVPQLQSHTPPGAVSFFQSDNSTIIKTFPIKDGRLFVDVTCYLFQETVHYAGKLMSSIDNTRAG